MTNELSLRDIARMRTVALLIAGGCGTDDSGRATGAAARTAAETQATPLTPAGIAGWFGAMQAQDLASGKWSFGLRLPDWTEADVDAAIERAEVLRTWPMRGTIHFVAAEDAVWLLTTTGMRSLRTAVKRRETLGLDDATAHRAAQLWGEALSGGRRLTRAAMLRVLAGDGIETTGQRGYHLLWYAAQIGVTCIGPNEGKEQTFVLLEDWAPNQRDLSGEEALAELALRYYRSHGPATYRELARWAGITMTESKAGIAAAGDLLASARHEGQQLHMAADLPDRASAVLAGQGRTTVYVPPGFDEVMLGYGDRAAMLPDESAERIVPGRNGVFRPTILIDGRVMGTWTRQRRTRKMVVTAEWFGEPGEAQRRGFADAMEGYAHFQATPVEIADP